MQIPDTIPVRPTLFNGFKALKNSFSIDMKSRMQVQMKGGTLPVPFAALRLAMMTQHLFGSYRIGGATAAGVKPSPGV